MILEISNIEKEIEINELFFINENEISRFDKKKYLYENFLDFIFLENNYFKPDFEIIDENMENGIREFLDDLGIDIEFCDFLDDLANVKDEVLELKWFNDFKFCIESSFDKKTE